MSDNSKPLFVEWYATQLEGFLATKGHHPEEILKYILNKLEMATSKADTPIDLAPNMASHADPASPSRKVK